MTQLSIADGNERMAVKIEGHLNPDDLIDSEISLRGICFNQHNRNRQFINTQLLVPAANEVEVLVPPQPKPFEAPLTPIASLLRFSPQADYRHRVHLSGQVTHVEPGQALWIRDDERGLKIQTEQIDDVQIGDFIDVVGFPARGPYSPELEDAAYRFLKRGAPPIAYSIQNEADSLRHDHDLVEFQAELIEKRKTDNGIELWLNWKGSSLRAHLSNLEIGLENLPREKSVLMVTGIGIFTPSVPDWQSGVLTDGAWSVALRSAQDLAIVVPAPWWTPQRAVWTLSLFLSLTIIAVGILIYVARRKLAEQARQREMAETEFSAILNERNRVAREIHDTLSQGLGATSVQLELARSHSKNTSEKLKHHLQLAHNLVRGALSEARNSIWNMRSHVLETSDLGEALESILKQLVEGSDIQTDFQVHGDRKRLSHVVENNLLRIGQEAITNATKHAQPHRIETLIHYKKNETLLRVRDDGIGFDAATIEDKRKGFGLIGMRERAQNLGCRISIESQPGRGTTITATIVN